MRYSTHVEVSPTGEPLCEVVVPLDTLAHKLGAGLGFDPAAIERAGQFVTALGEDFVLQTSDSIARMAAAVGAARTLPPSENVRTQLQEVELIAHDMRGLGGSFDYPLISTIGSLLYDSIHHRPVLDSSCLDVIELYVEALRSVMQMRIRGDGGDLGRALVTGLIAATKRRLPQ